MTTVFALALAALVPLSPRLPAQTPDVADARPTGFLSRTLTDDRGAHRYVVFVPPQYDPARAWPLIVFLNGAGECGTDGWAQVSVGLGPAILAQVERWPFLVVLPQKPDRSSAWEDHDAMVMAMLDAVRRDYCVDERRLFLTGLSQGGHGTWALGARHQNVWAAIAPVCGYGDGKAIAQDLAAMPIWCFHGDADRAVSVEQSRSITAAIAAVGGTPRLTIYPGVGHDSWVRAYRDEPLAAWLLMARDEPVLARYLAEPEAIVGARLNATVGRPLEQHRMAELTLSADAAAWKHEAGRDFSSSLRPPPPREGRLDLDTGRRFVAEQLAMLAIRGGFDAKRNGTPNAAAPGDGGPPRARDLPAWLLDVAIDGRHGPWSYHHAANDDSAGTAAVAAIEAIHRLAR